MSFPTVLLIDDDVVDRRAVRRALKDAGWDGELREASDVDTALEQVDGSSLVLLDYNLPALNGLELLPRLMAVAQVAPAVVMLTGEGSERIAVEAMKAGVADYLPKADLSGVSMQRILAAVSERMALHDELRVAREALERQALYDELTGLGNRRLFERDLAANIASAQRRRGAFTLLMMDLDGFKRANDQYGHEAGDAVLAGFAARLRAMVRAEDPCFRLGGDEFVAIVGALNAAELAPLLERIDSEAALPYHYAGTQIRVGVSIGAAFYPTDANDARELLARADTAMYAAKRGR